MNWLVQTVPPMDRLKLLYRFRIAEKAEITYQKEEFCYLQVLKKVYIDSLRLNDERDSRNSN